MRPPDQLTPEHIRRYQLHLARDRHLSWTYFNQIAWALRFFYRATFSRIAGSRAVVLPAQPR